MIHGEPAFGMIDELFYYVDEYFDDPEAAVAERELEISNLRAHARQALDRLLRLAAGN